MPHKLPSQERLQSLFCYDRSTGELTWKSRPQSDFRDAGSMNRFNGRYPNTIAGRVLNGGRKATQIDGVTYANHRLVWMLVNGNDPAEMEIDHINGNALDNRLENLRLATPSQNKCNRPALAISKTGVKGVIFNRNRYVATIRVHGKVATLGRFLTLEEARDAYAKAAPIYHGEFANVG